MIYLFSGTPGSGKSCHQAEIISFILKRRDGVVLANYSVNVDQIKGAKGLFVVCENCELTPASLVRFSRLWFKDHPFREGAIKLFIDEAQILFNSREWDKKDRGSWLKFFSQHRKYGFDIYLIAQFDRMLDRQIRSLIEYEVVHRRLDNGGGLGQIVNLLHGGHTYLAITVWYPMKQQLYFEYHHAYKRYYSLYDSYSDFDTANPSDGGSERSTDPVGEGCPSERSEGKAAGLFERLPSFRRAES